MDYKITQHAKERYTERIMERDNKTDIATFIIDHEEKIQKDIEKMIEFGEVIYQGVSVTEYNKENVKVILNGAWVIILNDKQNKVITLFKIDLGLGKEFNEEYISKLKEKLNSAKEKCEEAIQTINDNLEVYTNQININNDIIAENKKIIKSLESQNQNYAELINEESINKTLAEKEVREIVGVFVGRKVF